MTLATILFASKELFSISPMKMAIAVLTLSMASSLMLFKTILTSWMPFVVILTFSSGMMILFIYISSLSPNEKTKTKKSKMWMAIPLSVTLLWTATSPTKPKESMKTFSMQGSLIIMMLVLLITMIALAKTTFNPFQSTSSSF